MQFPRIGRFGFLLLALALPACDNGDDGISPDTGGNVVGEWALLSVAGNQLPFSQTVFDPDFGNCLYTLNSMDWDFMDAGRYSIETVTTLACGTEPAAPDTVAFAGSYRTEGNQLVTMEDEDTEEYVVTYTVSGDTFTMRDGNIVYVFRRDETE